MKFLHLSRFSHFMQYHKDENVMALYHTITMSVVFLPITMVENIKKFESGYWTNVFFLELPKAEQLEYRRLIKQLIKTKFLLEDLVDDDTLFHSIAQDIAKPYPNILYLMLSDGCNLACRYCFEGMNRENKTKTINMSEEVAVKALHFYSDIILSKPELFNQNKTIIFYGGEPLLNFNGLATALKEIKIMKKNGLLPRSIKLALITNGTLLDLEKAIFLRKHNVNVSISLDGAFKHNANRVFPDNQPAFPAIMRGYKFCREAKLQTSISCTISEANVDEVDLVVAEILKNKIFFLGFNVLLGKSSKEYQKKAATFILKAFSIFNNKGVYEDRMYRKIEAFCEKKQLLFDCGAAGGNQLVISPEGSIGICHGFFKERKYFADSVFNQKYNPLKTPTWLEWNKRTPFNMKECFDCSAISICGGGCLMNAEKEYGSIWEIDKRYCEHSKQSLEWLVWDLYESLDK